MDALAGEVDVAPSERAQLALAEAGHRGGEVQHGVLVGRGVACERGELLGVERDELAGVADGGPVDELGAGGVAGEPVFAHRVLEDAVRDGQVPDDGAGGQAGGEQLVAEGGDVGGTDGGQGAVAPAWLEVALERVL